MKLSKNPFFYLSLVLMLLVGFEAASFVWGATQFTEPTAPFPNSNIITPVIKTGSLTQDSDTGELIVSGPASSQVSLVNGAIILRNDTSLQSSAGLSFTPLTGGNWTQLYFGSSGFKLSQVNVNNGNALSITPGGTPSTSLGTGFNLDFNGSINARSFYVNGAPFTGAVASQWVATSSGIYYNGNVAINGNETVSGYIKFGSALLKTTNTASCPASTDYLLAKKWQAKTCTGSGAGCGATSCTTSERWTTGSATNGPSCNYSQLAGRECRTFACTADTILAVACLGD